MIAIQCATVCAITMTTADLTARRSERQVIDRLNGVIETLGQASFPFTERVLSQMKGLSGSEFIAYSAGGKITATSFSRLDDSPPPLQSIPQAARVDSLGEAPAVNLDGVSYFAVPILPSRGSRGSTLLVLYPETSWKQARREAMTPPFLLGLGALALMVAVTGWIAHRISRRIRVVEKQVARIAGGDFETIDAIDARDEISDLAGSINAMCRQLKSMSRSIQHSERTRVLSQLAAGLAHQLRNSLTGARMSVQLHSRRCARSEHDQSLQVALRQLTMTEEQVKGLLSLGRADRREPVACRLNRLLANIHILVLAACEHAKVHLDSADFDETAEAWADESGLRAVVLNLVLNAIEASGPGGTVRMATHNRGDRVSIEVSDTGPGPPPELAEKLFEPFVTSKPEGVGLGLAFARQIAAQNGGTLSWSRVDGETRFCLMLPRCVQAENQKEKELV
jgi:signal transduction histidine kinase